MRLVSKALFLAIVALLGGAATPACAQPIAAPVLKCETRTGSTLAKFTKVELKCISKCLAAKRAQGGQVIDCLDEADPTVSTCFFDPEKGAEAKGGAAIVGTCATPGACPQCYIDGPTGADGCSDASGPNPWVDSQQSQVRSVTFDIWCSENQNIIPPPPVAKCEDGLAKALAKFMGAKTKCYQKCETGIAKGTIPPGSCNDPTPTNPAIVVCIEGVEAKAATAVDKACFTPPAQSPACSPNNQGVGWVAYFEAFADDALEFVFCSGTSTTTSSTTTSTSSTTTSTIPTCHGTGVQVGGACWFFGQADQSCALVCFAQGLSYDATTTSYAGSGGTDAHCNAVLDAMNVDPGTLAFVATNCGVADECILAVSSMSPDTQRARCLDTPPDSSAQNANHRRACACN